MSTLIGYDSRVGYYAIEPELINAYVPNPGDMEEWEAQLLAEYLAEDANDQFLASVEQA